jgi:hypothetical protein
MSRAMWQQLLTDRLFLAIMLVVPRGDVITEAFDLAVSIAVFERPASQGARI